MVLGFSHLHFYRKGWLKVCHAPDKNERVGVVGRQWVLSIHMIDHKILMKNLRRL